MNQIEILYKGDIDDRPKNAVLALFGGYEWVTNDEGQPYRTFGTGGSPKFWLDVPEYELLRTICLANRLEAAQPKEQPPVEQSEALATHPLHAGYVIIDGEKRELRRKLLDLGVTDCCPFCEMPVIGTDCRKCNAALQALDDDYLWLAPLAVIEPEPELDEFVLELREWQANDDKDVAILERVIGLYREIITRKGDK